MDLILMWQRLHWIKLCRSLKFWLSSVLLMLSVVTATSSLAVPATQLVPRVIIGLYSSQDEENYRYSKLHAFAEMPLNHLGLILESHDVSQGLPDISQREDVRGVLTWFSSGDVFADPENYLLWAIDAIEQGKKFVVMGAPGFYQDQQGHETPIIRINRFWHLLGISDQDQWQAVTYGVEEVIKDKEMYEFERKLSVQKPPYHIYKTIGEEAKTYFSLRNKGDRRSESSLVVVSDAGGLAYQGYDVYEIFQKRGDIREDDLVMRQWYINPFLFFQKAFATEKLPIPDTTTLAGRRIYYSHIDGDGWNNITQIEEYKDKDVLSAQVIYQQVLRKYPDLPVSVGIIAADIDLEWMARPDSYGLAQLMAGLPHVELGTHTYSHPFEWGFFADNNPQKEAPLLSLYPGKTWQSQGLTSALNGWLNGDEGPQSSYALAEKYDIPRAYAVKPFDLDLETNGAIDKVNGLTAGRKKVKVYMWSGNTAPFEEAVKKVREAGVYNINGGDSRYDYEYDSYAWVSPTGIQVGKERQIYSSNSNENTYTDLWQGRYHGFRDLQLTLENTDSPIRVKPFNLYYHIYSGERIASLNALLENLTYARTQKITPIATSEFAAIANGFYSSEFFSIGNMQWQIKNRGALQTIRFDHCSFCTVEYQLSQGIIGHNYLQGSLYVYLDANVLSPILKLSKLNSFDIWKASTQAYLVESRWPVWALHRTTPQFYFTTQGYGQGEMTWIVPASGEYTITAYRQDELVEEQKIQVKEDRHLSFTLQTSALRQPLKIEITKLSYE
jgi:hypothetical protein